MVTDALFTSLNGGNLHCCAVCFPRRGAVDGQRGICRPIHKREPRKNRGDGSSSAGTIASRRMLGNERARVAPLLLSPDNSSSVKRRDCSFRYFQ
jgi:hypothetical protein